MTNIATFIVAIVAQCYALTALGHAPQVTAPAAANQIRFVGADHRSITVLSQIDPGTRNSRYDFYLAVGNEHTRLGTVLQQDLDSLRSSHGWRRFVKGTFRLVTVGVTGAAAGVFLAMGGILSPRGRESFPELASNVYANVGPVIARLNESRAEMAANRAITGFGRGDADTFLRNFGAAARATMSAGHSHLGTGEGSDQAALAAGGVGLLFAGGAAFFSWLFSGKAHSEMIDLIDSITKAAAGPNKLIQVEDMDHTLRLVTALTLAAR